MKKVAATKKLVTVTAVRCEELTMMEVADWCAGSLILGSRTGTIVKVKTPDGVKNAAVGDWVIREARGVFSTMKHDDFLETYDLEL